MDTVTAPGVPGAKQMAVARFGDVEALPLVRACASAAVACAAWVGRGDKHAADQAAVAAMRRSLAGLPFRASVVFGEGEKDAAPMLCEGELFGPGPCDGTRDDGATVDLVIDPLEGTTLCATAGPGAVTVIGATPAGRIRSLSGFYMEKLVVGSGAAHARLDLDAPVVTNMRRMAVALAKPVAALRVAVLKRPRNEALVHQIRATGAAVREIEHGDVMASLETLDPDGELDCTMGIGGTPEGVITACAARALGGTFLGRQAPQSADEAQRVREAGHAGVCFDVDTLVGAGPAILVCSGVTGSHLLLGPELRRGGARVHSLVAGSHHGLLRVSSVLPPA